jgi:LysM repeat protein
MLLKTGVRWSMMAAFVVALLATPRAALAWSGCGDSYVVQAGDTLASVADACGTSVEAIRQANPNLDYWIYPGQSLWLPGDYQGGGNYYGDQYAGGYYGSQGGSNCYGYPGGTNCYGYQDGGSYYGGQNSSNCYGAPYGGYAYAPAVAQSGATYVVRSGDTMRIIAERMGIPLCDLLAANPQIWNPSLIYPGQVICLPLQHPRPAYYPWGRNDGHRWHQDDTSGLYTILRGESMKDIAKKFNTTVEELMKLNPTLKRPSYIHAGMVIHVW